MMRSENFSVMRQLGNSLKMRISRQDLTKNTIVFRVIAESVDFLHEFISALSGSLWIYYGPRLSSCTRIFSSLCRQPSY